jgi:hypothetical protein
MPWRPKVPSPTWRSFLHNHLTDIAAIDMFVVAKPRMGKRNQIPVIVGNSIRLVSGVELGDALG